MGTCLAALLTQWRSTDVWAKSGMSSSLQHAQSETTLKFRTETWLLGTKLFSVGKWPHFACEQLTTLLSLSRWPHFCLWADDLTFVYEQTTTLLSVIRWLFFCLDQITTLLSVNRLPNFFLWADVYTDFCEHITTLLSESNDLVPVQAWSQAAWHLFFNFVS